MGSMDQECGVLLGLRGQRPVGQGLWVWWRGAG